MLEEYVFTVKHDGYTAVDIGDVSSNKGKTRVVGSVTAEIQRSVEELRHTLQELQPLPGKRFAGRHLGHVHLLIP